MVVPGEVVVSESDKPCELCGRHSQLTRHHLIPRTRHRNKRVQKTFRREEMQNRLLWVCRSCHGHIHKCLVKKSLPIDTTVKNVY